jgi:hypothetical protein
MEGGAQTVELEVTGSAGAGRVTIPVDAVARRVLKMPKFLGAILAVLGVILVALLLSIIGASVRESVLEPGIAPDRQRRLKARGAVALAALILALLLMGGRKWWWTEAADYQNRRVYHPIAVEARVLAENNQRRLRLEITDPKFADLPPLVPDHGKLVHLFLVREPKLDAFAHLHPVKRDRKTFECFLPNLAPGNYQLYADITLETGWSDTLTAAVDIPESPAGGKTETVAPVSDPDDSWWTGAGSASNLASPECRLKPNLIMTWHAPDAIVPNQPVSLRFIVRDETGQVAGLEPYLGMRGHLALRRDDGSVFIHLHPGGSASMAAMQLSLLRAEGRAPLAAAFGADEPICQVPLPSPNDQLWINGSDTSEGVSFPYAFPKPGRYRLWVQVKIKGEILTGVFDVQVGQVPSVAASQESERRFSNGENTTKPKPNTNYRSLITDN